METGTVKLNETSLGHIVEYHTHIRSQNYNRLLAFQTKPNEAIYFKDKEITIEKLIEILEKAEIE